jgi:hypothetical protein
MARMPGPSPYRLVRRTHRTAGFAVATAVLAALLALLAGCTSGSRPGAPPPASRLAAALGHWASFPVGATARPLVIQTGAKVTGPGKFPSVAAANGFDAGAISLPRSLPSGPAQLGSFSLISAARAAKVLTSGPPSGQAASPPPPPSPSPSPSTRVIVTRVRLGSGIFPTDRGRLALPAWQFSLRGVPGTVDVLAVAASQQFWPAGLKQVSTHLSAAQPGRSGRVLTLTVLGAQAGTGPCQATYSVRQQSSAHAVALYVVAKEHGSGQGGCSSAGYRVTLPVTLAAPLGNRVLVDAATFAFIPVTQPLVSSS